MGVKNTEAKSRPFDKVRSYYRNNMGMITLAWAGLNPNYVEYVDLLRRYA